MSVQTICDSVMNHFTCDHHKSYRFPLQHRLLFRNESENAPSFIQQRLSSTLTSSTVSQIPFLSILFRNESEKAPSFINNEKIRVCFQLPKSSAPAVFAPRGSVPGSPYWVATISRLLKI